MVQESALRIGEGDTLQSHGFHNHKETKWSLMYKKGSDADGMHDLKRPLNFEPGAHIERWDKQP